MKKGHYFQNYLLLLLISTTIFFTSGCKKEEVPTVTTSPITNILGTKATGGGNITSNGGAGVIESGLCWSPSPTPTITDPKTTDGLLSGAFMSNITGLTMNTTYYVRAYATNGTGTGYGETVSFTTSATPSVGDYYQGGYVIYLLQPGEPGYDASTPHGLITATSDQSSGIAWWNGSYSTTGAVGTAYGTGASNSSTIIANQGIGSYAAKMCENLVLNGYSDWYLPSKVELNMIYENRYNLGYTIGNAYWCSSEYSNTLAWMQSFSSGAQGTTYKDDLLSVRAVRTF